MSENEQFTCRICGLEHAAVSLKPKEKAVCRRCHALLATGKRFGSDGPLCFALTGLVLAVPATLLPFVGAEKLGDERTSLLLTGVGGFWHAGMWGLAVLVVFFGEVLPIALLLALVALHLPGRLGGRLPGARSLARAADVIGSWAMPEVQVLAVFVALEKLGSSLNLRVGPGFWCYCGMALALLLARHGFGFERHPAERSEGDDPQAAPFQVNHG